LGHFPKINLDNFEGKRNIGAEECLMGWGAEFLVVHQELLGYKNPPYSLHQSRVEVLV
jgi:hypothetical protein